VINKHATRVEVTPAKDGKTATVEDNGAASPSTRWRSQERAPRGDLHDAALGGKFERGKSYEVSGGLHGVARRRQRAVERDVLSPSTRRRALE